MRQRITITVLVASLFLTVTAQVSAGQGSRLTADLEGRPIAASSSSGYFCHDFDFPRIHCFRTAAALNAAIGIQPARSVRLLAAAPATPAGTWVTVYSDASYAGSFAYLSHNYDKLGDIGWNDIISSFRVQATFNGRFARDTFGAGWQYFWYAGQNIPYVGSSYNDQFSSFYRS
jgi:hypothetical protein